MENKKKGVGNKKKIIILFGIIVLFIFLIIIPRFKENISTQQVSTTGQAVGSQQVKIVPLSQEERQKVGQILLSSEFIKDIPEKESISLMFYTFEGGQRIWQDGFLIGRNKFLSEGNPGIQLTIHSKYISELNDNNLCEIIKKAKQNGDLGFYSEYSKTKLLIKFAGMLKHRGCFGV